MNPEGEATLRKLVADRGALASFHRPSSPYPGSNSPLNLDIVGAGAANDDAAAKSAASPRRLGWANLLARVFAVDVTVCRECGGRMRILDVVRDPDDIARILHGARAPPRPPRAHPPGHVALDPVLANKDVVLAEVRARLSLRRQVRHGLF